MSSLNQLISEIAHSIQQPNNVGALRAIRQGIIHSRNELIRQSYSNHNYTDKILKQNYNLVINPYDDSTYTYNFKIVLRSDSKIKRPIRLSNNLPFHSVKLIQEGKNYVCAYTQHNSIEFYKFMPGMENAILYDIINDYLFIFSNNAKINIENYTYANIEGIFEYPHILTQEDLDTNYNDDNEFFLPEDLVNAVKKLTLETLNAKVKLETNEVPHNNLVK